MAPSGWMHYITAIRDTTVVHCNFDEIAYQMNPFWQWVTVGHHARVFITNWRPTEPEDIVKLLLEGYKQHDA